MIRFVALVALLLVSASAQLEIRPQSTDSYPQHDQGDQTGGQNTIEILPASYIGCWQGLVAAPDAIRNFNGCLNGPFVPELYTLCYRRKQTGKFELTFSGVQMDTNVPAGYEISGTTGKVEVLWSDGSSRVRLRSLIHFDQKQIASEKPIDGKWSMSEQTDMACAIKDGGMEVNATYVQTSDGTECFKGTWHTRFHRFED